MNVNELIDKYKKSKLYSLNGVVTIEKVIKDLEQLRTIEYSRKVKVHPAMADYIEQEAEINDLSLMYIMKNFTESEHWQTYANCDNNYEDWSQVLANAVMHGYEVKEEPNKEAVKQANETVKTQAHALGHDVVNSPNHYTAGGIETIDYIKAKMTSDQFAGYCTGNILKYISRYPFKNGVEDLEKAKVYLEWLISAEGERL